MGSVLTFTCSHYQTKITNWFLVRTDPPTNWPVLWMIGYARCIIAKLKKITCTNCSVVYATAYIQSQTALVRFT